MTPTPPQEPKVPPARPVPRARKTFGIIWLVPVVAIGLALWVAWTTWSSRGPQITVTFQTASGIEAGKTKLRYRDIEIGQVSAATIGGDLKSVEVDIQVQAEASGLIREGSRFWVVRPRIGGGQVSGLETLISGAYIEVDPGEGGKLETEFTGLENPPRVRSDTPGRSFVLRTPTLGSLSIGSPVMFRGITVGEITDFDPPTERGDLILHLFVRQPYAELVSTTSRFWRERAFDFELGADGVQFSVGNVATLLRGGVVFDSPQGGAPAEEEHAFNLFDSAGKLAEGTITERIPVISYFDGSVRGLSPGAPVELRGMPIGTVREIGIEYDVADREIRIPVIYEIEPERIRIVDGVLAKDLSALASFVQRGLRAQLATGSLITGQMMVTLDFVPGAPPAKIGQERGMIRMPTAPSSLDTLERSLTGIMEKIATLPIDDLTEQLAVTADAIAKIAGSGELQESLVNVNEVLTRLSTLADNLNKASVPALAELERTTKALGDAARSADTLMGPRSGTRQDINVMLKELTSAARSIGNLADYLERHPEALLRGKTGGYR
ncbi:PqiB family protein [Geminicoccus roseus]|uniref:PqiB family protein n=1 Tax=Geminicoccus roseus TaxID=404900 RepID=UPI00041A3548|nr:MlaD family protein [Geminicoccus roseus]